MGHHRSRPITRATLATLTAATALAATLAGCSSSAHHIGAAAPVTPPVATPTPTSTPTPTATPTPSFDPETFAPPAATTAALVKRFGYDTRAPLGVHVVSTDTPTGVTIQHITYSTPGREPVEAEIVYPTAGHGRMPGVVLAHGGAIDPDAFLPEARTLAAHGIVSILPDIPMTIDGNAANDIAWVTNSVIAERRALDILVARSDVDPTRLAFVGHSWGADLAAIMAGVDPRLSAVVIACATSRMATDMYAMGSPAQPAAYMAATSVLDGYRFVAIPHARRILIQYGRQDTSIPDAQRTELTHSATGRSTRRDYDAGHDLVSNAPATADRQSFLLTAFHLH